MSFSFIIIKDGESSGSQVFWELFLTCPLENLVLFSFFVTNFEWPLTTNNTRKLILVMCVSTLLPNLRFMFNNCYNPHCRMGSITANHSSPRWLAGEKKSNSNNHKTTIWVSHEYFLNPEFHKIQSRAFWVIAILGFSPHTPIVDFKGLISKKGLEIGLWAQNT